MPPKVVRRTLDLAGVQVPLIEITGSGGRPAADRDRPGCTAASTRRWPGSAAGRAALESAELRGRVRAVPVLNMSAFRARTPFVVPEDGKNLNRCFPGNPSGTLAERLAHADVHPADLGRRRASSTCTAATWSRRWSRSRCTRPGRPRTGRGRWPSPTGSATCCGRSPDRIARSAARPAPRPRRSASPRSPPRRAAAGWSSRPRSTCTSAGSDRVLAVLGMTAGEAAAADGAAAAGGPATPDHLSRFLWLRCADEGWWEPAVGAGARVTQGQVLGSVTSIDGARTQEVISAPADGVLLFLTEFARRRGGRAAARARRQLAPGAAWTAPLRARARGAR